MKHRAGGVTQMEGGEEMTLKEMVLMRDWLKAFGLKDKEIDYLQKYMTGAPGMKLWKRKKKKHKK